jgi:hypothetical protein
MDDAQLVGVVFDMYDVAHAKRIDRETCADVLLDVLECEDSAMRMLHEMYEYQFALDGFLGELHTQGHDTQVSEASEAFISRDMFVRFFTKKNRGCLWRFVIVRRSICEMLVLCPEHTQLERHLRVHSVAPEIENDVLGAHVV